MRLVLIAFIGGCAVEDDTPDCRPPTAAVLQPADDAVVPPPEVDVRVRWRRGPYHYDGPVLRDMEEKWYQPLKEMEPDGVYVYRYMLPPSTAFSLVIYGVDVCHAELDGMGARSLTLASRRFRTGP